jgi:hypothetical protein
MRTRPIKDLIPDGFLDASEPSDKAAALGLPDNQGVRPGAGAGLTIGRKRLGV